MVTGRKRMSPEQAEATGYYKKHPERKNASCSKSDGIEPPVPSYFNDDEKQTWAKTIADMKKIGSLSSDLGQLIEAYVVAYCGWLSLRKRIEKEGETITVEKTGGIMDVKRHPLLPDLHKLRDQANKLLPELGLSPTQRSKYNVEGIKEVAPFEQWLEQSTRSRGDN